MFVVIVVAERVDRRLPGALVGLVTSTILVAVLGLRAHGVAVPGTLAHGAPQFGLPGLSWSTFGSVAPIAAVVALVVVTQSAATTRAFADQGHYEVDVGRDFLGVGAGSIVAGLAGAFPVNASPPRTAAVRCGRSVFRGRPRVTWRQQNAGSWPRCIGVTGGVRTRRNVMRAQSPPRRGPVGCDSCV